MRIIFPLIAAGALVPCASAQSADTGWYAGIGYEHLEEKDTDFSFNAVNLTGGYDFSRYLGAEVTAAVGVDGTKKGYPEYTIDTASGPVLIGSYRTEATLNYRVEVVGVAKLPLTDAFRLTGKAGVSRYKFDYTTETGATPTSNGMKIRTSPDGYSVAAGVGAEYDVTGSLSLSGNYMYYGDQGIYENGVDGFQLQLKKRF